MNPEAKEFIPRTQIRSQSNIPQQNPFTTIPTITREDIRTNILETENLYLRNKIIEYATANSQLQIDNDLIGFNALNILTYCKFLEEKVKGLEVKLLLITKNLKKKKEPSNKINNISIDELPLSVKQTFLAAIDFE